MKKKKPTGGGQGTNGSQIRGVAKSSPAKPPSKAQTDAAKDSAAMPSIEMPESVSVRSASLAEDAGYVALKDIAELNIADSRIVGGHMVSLHVYRHGLTLHRATSDADLGLTPVVLKTNEATTQLRAMGYERAKGNRYAKPIANMVSETGPVLAEIDLLVAGYSSRMRDSVQHGETNTTEVPGLSLAFQRPSVVVQAHIRFSDESEAEFGVTLPDEVSALAIKALTTQVRSKDSDAVDVWRCLEVCRSAGIKNVDFGSEAVAVDRILRRDFTSNGSGTKSVIAAQSLNAEQAAKRSTRLTALVNEVLPS